MYTGQQVINGRVFTIEVETDEHMSAPWVENDGHGPVREGPWRSLNCHGYYNKSPGQSLNCHGYYKQESVRAPAQCVQSQYAAVLL